MKAATTAKYSLTQKLAISIHAAREGGDFLFIGVGIIYSISIHAAREGGDPFYCLYVSTGSISIHAAREGGDRKTHYE